MIFKNLDLLCFVAIVSLATAADESPSKFKITSKRDTDKVEVKVEKEKTVFSITSPVGISEATIERTGEVWPDGVVLRLHLKGLENFQVMSKKVTLNASVSSHDEEQQVRLWKGGKEDAPLDAKSPLWIEIDMIGADGKSAKDIPLKDGYFEMALPKAFFEGNPKSIKVKWTDFFRN